MLGPTLLSLPLPWPRKEAPGYGLANGLFFSTRLPFPSLGFHWFWELLNPSPFGRVCIDPFRVNGDCYSPHFFVLVRTPFMAPVRGPGFRWSQECRVPTLSTFFVLWPCSSFMVLQGSLNWAAGSRTGDTISWWEF